MNGDVGHVRRPFTPLVMPSRYRVRIVFHGAIVLLVGLLIGFPTGTEVGSEANRLWHTAHESLIMMGVWLLTMGSVFPVLALERREAAGLFWALLATAYGFMVALVLEGMTGMRAFQPTTSPILLVGFAGNVIGVLGALLAALLTLTGARAALKAERGETSESLARSEVT